jgi:PAS domain S-box-containing protein
VVAVSLPLFDGIPCEDSCPPPRAGQECRITRRDGEERIVSRSCNVMRDGQGAVVGGVEVLLDITEARKLERELETTESRLREIFDNMRAGVAVYEAVDDGRDFVFRDFNKTGASIERMNRDDVIGRSVREVFPGVTEMGLFEVFHRVWRTGKPEEFPATVYRDERIEGWRDNFVYKLPSGEVVAIYQDLTVQKRAEAALRQSEERFRKIFEESPIGMVVVSPGFRFEHVNATFCRMLGYRREDLIGRSLVEVWHPDDREENLQRARSLRDGHIPSYSEEFRYVGKEGQIVWVESTASIVRDEDGETLYGLGMVVDLTERKRAEEARRAVERELQQQRALAVRSDRMRSLGEMAAGIAHELSQPLVGVRGIAEHIKLSLERGWDLSEEKLNERLASIIQQADRMTYIISHARGFARGAEASDTEPVDMNSVIQSCVDLVGAQLRAQGVELVCHLSEDLPRTSGNPFALEEVVLNLMLNARDALLEQDPARLEIRTDAGGGRVRIRVADSGTGMTDEVLERAQEPFFTTKGPQEGTGLGLTISKSIVERFGGTLDIRSRASKGTTVTIRLPELDTSG